MRTLSALRCAALLVLSGAACSRGAKSDLGVDRTVEAGLPVALGAGDDETLWDTGEGGKPFAAEKAVHVFQRSGVFTVRALREGTERSRVKLTVVPRPVLRAIPGDADGVLFVPALAGNIDALVSFSETLLGADSAQRAFQQFPLASLVLEALGRGTPATGTVDPQEGMAVFTLPDFEGAVGLVGVQDEKASLASVVEEARETGATARLEGGLTVLQAPDGFTFALFADRGYLYAVHPGDRLEPERFVKAAAGVQAHVKSARPAGLSENARLAALRARTGPGNLFLFFGNRPEHVEAKDGVEAFFGAMQVAQGRLGLDGLLATRGPLFPPAGRFPTLLGQAPQGPIGALQLTLPPQQLGALVFGAPDSPRRERARQSFAEAGVTAEELIGAFRGDVGLLVYFDAPAFFANLVRGSSRPEPRGTILLEMGLSNRAPVEKFIQKQLEASPTRVEVFRERDSVRYRARLFEQTVDVSLAGDRLVVNAGEVIRNRKMGDLAALLRTRSAGQAFAPGQASLFIDFGELRQEINAPKQVPGVPDERLAAVQAFASSFLDQLTPFDHAFLNLSPEAGGARLKGEVILRGP